MKPGRMDKEIVLQRKTVQRDGYGEAVETWTATATVWAQVTETGAREFVAGAELTEERRTFLIRQRDDITAQDRVMYRDIAHDIRGIRRDVFARGDGMELLTVATY